MAMLVARVRPALILAAIGSLFAPAVLAATKVPGGVDKLVTLAALLLLIVLGKLGGLVFERQKLPAVLGELWIGIVVGNLGLVGFHGFETISANGFLELVAEFGAMLLLFQVGLETDLRKMGAVGASATLVAVLGVVAPMLLGLGVSAWFLGDQHVLAHWFVGATLSATSVGITARVLADIGRAASVEGRIILGAAVIDDVLGLLVLAVVTGLIQAANAGQPFDVAGIAIIVGKALGFLVAVVVVGRWLAPPLLRLATRLLTLRMLVPVAVAFFVLVGWLAGLAGLAPIVGAFAAGLVLADEHKRELQPRLKAIAWIFVPVFFVLMGMRVDLTVFGRPDVLGFAAALTAAAIIGKQVCSLGVLERGTDRLAVGLGMIPRGEVGLIFASIGSTLVIGGERVVNDMVYSAVVVMVAITTLVTPPLLVWRLRRSSAREASRG